MILGVLAPRLYRVVLLAAVWVLLRGHNEPGGGFIGGLVAVGASVTLALATGSTAAARRLPLRSPLRCATAGVLLALASGLPAVLAGRAYMTHAWHDLALGPLVLPVSTVYLFDLGVFLAVWGALAGQTLALLELGEAEEQA